MADKLFAFGMTLAAAFMVVAAIGGGSWKAAWFAGSAAWFAWVVVWRTRPAQPSQGDCLNCRNITPAWTCRLHGECKERPIVKGVARQSGKKGESAC